MTLRTFLDRIKERNRLQKEIEVSESAESRAHEKKLTANERELSRFVEEQRQKEISKTLSHVRDLRQKEFMHKNVIHQKNLFNNQDRGILKWR